MIRLLLSRYLVMTFSRQKNAKFCADLSGLSAK